MIVDSDEDGDGHGDEDGDGDGHGGEDDDGDDRVQASCSVEVDQRH